MTRSQRLARWAAVAIWSLALPGCATMRLNTYAAPGFDVDAYRTYTWAAGDQLATGDPRLDNNPFFLERLRTAVDQQLAERGFERVTSGRADLLLHYHARVEQQLDLRATDDPSEHCDECDSSVYDAGTIMLDLVDGPTNTLVWRGWAEGSIQGAIDDQQLMEERIDEAVARILARLPRRS
jgi:hypothetical protein